MANRTVSVRLQAEIGNYVGGMAKAALATKGVGESADVSGKKAKAGFDLAGKSAMFFGGAVAGALVGIVTKSTQFEKSMSAVQAATHASVGTLGDLRQAAMDAGADTAYSATEAADAITEMSKAGVSAGDIMGGGLNGALALAAAGQLDVADAAGIASVAMTQFSLSGKDLPHVADLLAAGAGKAMGSVDDLGQALNQAGLIASAAGLSIEETTGGLAAFASAGLVGSDAGTSFKTMLQALQAPTEKSAGIMADLGINMYDSQGKMLGLSDMAGQLQTHMSGLTEEQRNAALATIFGSDAVRAANVLYTEGAAGIQDWTAKVNDSGYAAETAAALQDNLSGDLEKLGGSFETLMIQMGSGAQGPLREVVQMLTGMLDGVAAAANAWGDLPGPVQATIAVIGGLVLLNGPLSGVLTTLTSFGETAALKMMAARDAVSSFSGVAGAAKAGVGGLVSLLGGPWGVAIAAIAGSFALLSSATEDNEEVTSHAADAQRGLADALRASKGAIDETVRSAAAKSLQDAGLLDIAEKAGIALPLMTDAILGNKAAYDQAAGALQNYANNRLIASGYEENGKTALHDQAAAAQGAVTDFNTLAGTLGETAAQQGQLAAASATSSDAMANAVDPAEEFQTGLENISTAASDSKKQIDLYKTSLDILNGAHITAIQAESDFYAALDSTKTALTDATGRVIDETGALDLHTDAGRKTADALVGVKDKADQWISTMIEQGATSDEANAKDAELRQSFYETALQMTGSKEAASRLTDEIYGIPDERTTTITADTKQATDAAAAVQRAIDNLKGRTITVSVATMNTGNGVFQQSYETANGGRALGVKYQATGGPVIGPGGPTDDRAGLYALSNGEHVWTAAETAAVGGHSAMEEMRREALANGRGRATGGPIGIGLGLDAPNTADQITAIADAALHKAAAAYALTAAGPAGSGSGMSGTWTSIAGIVQRAIPQARINSTYRPGDPGYHGKNKAVDFGYGSGPGGNGSAGLAAIARFLYTGYGRSLAEIIYDGIGDNTPDVKNGKDHVYNAATRAEHHNHVHAAVYHDGTDYVPQTGWAYLEKGERVIPASLNSREFSGGSGGSFAPQQVTVNLDNVAVSGVVEVGSDGLMRLVDGRVDSALATVVTGAQRR